ncbi:DUF4435 domain-containing protein [Pseudomonas fragi]|uniref:DUF4435 domain-containing protein n=1 Tax=Pseudomonas fragi TaxID=296 RepID=UPI001F366712|nr:DUF4435 domain-containing protein [Pseudomonas fragi]MCF6763809.1 DUF4435 domain-containing protein [Pseudomonas fragi]
MINDDKDVGFVFDAADSERTRFFNIDGSTALNVNVWVEAQDDKRFWSAFLTNSESYKFSYKLGSEESGHDGKVGSGCRRLVKLERQGVIKIGLGEIICMDSDGSYLREKVPGYVDAQLKSPHIYYTNVYAIENVYLHPQLLNDVLKFATASADIGRGAKPSELIASISALCFSLVINTAFLEVVDAAWIERSKIKARTKSILIRVKMIDCVSGLKACAIHAEVAGRISALSKELTDYIFSLSIDPRYNKYLEDVTLGGIGSDNCYLFLQGHSIYEGVVCAIDKLNDYWRNIEINKVRGEANFEQKIKYITSNWPDVQQLLKSSYCAHRPKVEFFEDVRSRLLEAYEAVPA